MIMSNTNLYSTMTYADIFDSYETFVEKYDETPFNDVKTELGTNLEVIYYMLYGRYGNSPIKNNDINQFIFKFFYMIRSYGTVWSKRDTIQKNIRSLTEDEIMTGSKQIHNLALNPQIEPGTGTEDNLDYINQQDAINYKKSKMDAYIQLYSLLDDEYTETFLDRFSILFKTYVGPTRHATYIEKEEE